MGAVLSLVSARMAGLAVALLSTIAVARMLGLAEYGVYATAASVAGVVTIFGLMGQDQLYIRGTLGLQELRRRLLRMVVAIAAATSGLCVVWPSLSGRGLAAALLLTSSLAVSLLAAPYLLAPQRRLTFGTRGRREFVQRVLLAAGPVTGAAYVKDARFVALGSLAAALVFLAVAGWGLRSERQVESVKDSLPPAAGLPFAVSGALFSVMTIAPPLALSALAPGPEVGELRLALTILLAAQAVPIALNTDVLRSRMYRAARDGDGLGQLTRRSLLGTVGLAALVSLCGFLLAPTVTTLAYGDEFRGASSVLRMLFVGFPFFCISTWAATVLVVAGAEARVAQRQLLTTGTLACGLVLGLLIGPTAAGAALAMVVSELVGLLIYFALGPRFLLDALSADRHGPAEGQGPAG